MNGILLVDKPAGWTSHDVVAKLRGALHERHIGHSGTLDPMATGLLVVFVGKATKAVEFAEADKKRYLAGLILGFTTDTLDVTGEILAQCEAEVSQAQFDAVLTRFRGEIDQVPPMYSAVKIGGERLYKMARRGQEIERPARKITIHSLERTEPLIGGGTMLDVVCSKGTYIRSLCADIGSALGCGATMNYLRRVQAGTFDIGQAHTLEVVERFAQEGRAEELLLPMHTLFSDRAAFTVNANQEKKLRNGCAFQTDTADGEYRVFSKDGAFLMLGRCESGEMRFIKNFF